MGELYLSNVDFLKNGVPASIIATLVGAVSRIEQASLLILARQVVSTLGFILMKIIG